MASSILFVDDSALARAAATRRLTGRGLHVTALGSSREVEGIDPTTFAAALLDIELGDGFGPDVAARLRLGSPGLPIAFLTGGGSVRRIDAALAIGPVFSKTEGVDAAIGWVLAIAGI
jgi:two-component system, response regulator RegA